MAGNRSAKGFYHHIIERKFRNREINISDSFLNKVLPEFSNVEGFPADKKPIEQFMFVNTVLRDRNNSFLLSLGTQSDPEFYWSGRFLRLPRSSTMAFFADHRTYMYKGKAISQADHMGIDLAAIRNAPVPAANSGKVVFAGNAGIYGNAVVIDHGFGLMSLYGHLSRILVSAGEMVKKGSIIGHTGSSGLAGGDHLHFAIIIDHIFADPIEWWDGNWVKANILSKTEKIQKSFGGNISTSGVED